MIETVLRLRQSYLEERGEPPSAVRIATQDWVAVLAELTAKTGGCEPHQQRAVLVGTVPLVDPDWRKGLPVCLDVEGAAEAIRQGARPPS